MGICYVVGAGDYFDASLRPGETDFVIAADGGYEHLKKAGIRIDLLIGDFDSIAREPDPVCTVRLRKEKNDTDMMAALREGLARGYREFRLYGGTGGRIDHTLANIQALAFLCENGARGMLYGEGCTMTAIRNGTYQFEANRSGYVSVFSLSDHSSGVTLRGLKYPLDRAKLVSSFPLGTSNEFTNCPGSISVENGTLLIVCTDQRTEQKP